MIPGSSFSGKTTLVRALVDAGAVYYSDEFAALDETGRVFRYAKWLSVRRPNQGGTITRLSSSAASRAWSRCVRDS